jgi:uncharacterized protein YegP (UPF0339 family)
MFKIKVMQAPDGKYYWVMYSKNGQVICRSDRHEERLAALYTASLVKGRGVKVELDRSSAEVGFWGGLRKSYGF